MVIRSSPLLFLNLQNVCSQFESFSQQVAIKMTDTRWPAEKLQTSLRSGCLQHASLALTSGFRPKLHRPHFGFSPETAQATQECFGARQRQDTLSCATLVHAMRYDRDTSQTTRRGIRRHEATRIVLASDVYTCIHIYIFNCDATIHVCVSIQLYI